jgi:hypothetical protein
MSLLGRAIVDRNDGIIPEAAYNSTFQMTHERIDINFMDTSRKTAVALLLGTLLVMVAFDRPLIRGDGIAYLAWVDTFVVDLDIDFANQLERLQPVNSYQLIWNDDTQRLVNIFPFGVALVQAPFYAIGHWFAANGWWDANPDYFHQMQGVWRPYSLWLMIGANAIGLATLWLTWRIGRKLLPTSLAALLTFAFFLGTPLLFYSTVSPLNSHGAGALAFALFLTALLRIRPIQTDSTVEPATAKHYIWLGAAAGLMVLVRWQLLLVAAPAWLLLLPARGERPQWRGGMLATVAAAVTLLPLPLVWQQLFGQPFVIPYEAVSDSAFLSWPRFAGEVMRLLLIHSPIVLLSLAGIPFLWRRNWRWGAYLLGTVALQVWLNGGVLDWWAGETYGMRRMSELFPLYVLGAAALLAAWRGGMDSAESRARRAAPTLLLIALSLYALAAFAVFINYTWTTTSGNFINDPTIMWQHVLGQSNRWQTTWAVYKAHLGPLAWYQPGP